jgi:hypothetical protein
MKEEKTKNKYRGAGAGCGAVYGLGFIGAVVYYIQNSPTFMDGVIGVLKAMVWPAFLIYRVLSLLKM